MFKCHCGEDVHDNGSFSCGYCGNCGTFFHAMQRLLPGYDSAHDPYGYVPDRDDLFGLGLEPRTVAQSAIPSSET